MGSYARYMSEPSKKHPRTYSSGGVFVDGTIIELIRDVETGGTAFAVGRGNDVNVVQTVELEDGTTALPIPATNNLIRHRAVLLPGRPEPFANVTTLLADIRAYIARYVDLSPDFLVVASAYVLFSWVYDAFNELPYLRFRGDFGSGKTRALTVVGSLLYKAFFASGASTVSPIFYTLDTFRGSLVIDESDFRFSDKDADIVKILNNGNVQGFPVLRQTMNQKREFDPRAFAVFGPKILAMRNGFEDIALESRFLTEEMGQRAVSKDIPVNLPKAQEVEAAHLRNQLLMYRLKERNHVAVDPSFVDATLAARTNQILVPLLSVVPTTAERHAIERVATHMDHELRTDRALLMEASVLTVLVSLFRETPDRSVKVSDVAVALSHRFGQELERPISARYVGYLIRKRLHLSTVKSHGVYVVAAAEQEKVLILAKRFGALDGD